MHSLRVFELSMLLLISGLIGIVVVGAARWAIQPELSEPMPVMDTGNPPVSPLTAKLLMSRAPALGETAALSLTITSAVEATNVTVKIVLPEGLQLVEGELEWHGSIAPGGRAQLTAIVRATLEGDCRIYGEARNYFSHNSWFGANDSIFLSISRNGGQFITSTEQESVSPGAAGTRASSLPRIIFDTMTDDFGILLFITITIASSPVVTSYVMRKRSQKSG
jgi:hypothetical protein